MSLLDTILSGVGVVGNALDTPGAIVRNSLAGRNPFTGLNPFDAEGRASGRDVLETWGMLDPNEEGLDFGDVAGFGAEMLTDPLNLLGANSLRHVSRAAGTAREANAASDALRAAGAMPEEIAALTKIVDESGAPRRMYHGSNAAFDRFDPEKLDPNALFGKGIYNTSEPSVADTYAMERAWRADPVENTGANVRQHYLDIRNPLRLDSKHPLIPDGVELPEDIPESMLPWVNKVARGDRKTAIQGYMEQYKSQESRLSDLKKRLAEYHNSIDKRRYNRDYAYHLENQIAVGTYVRDKAIQNLQDAFRSRNAPLSVDDVDNLKALTHDDLYDQFDRSGIEKLGFDGIVHQGGIRVGGAGKHDVAIAFDPSQVYFPAVIPPLQDVPSLNPLLATLLGHNAMTGYSRAQ